MKPEIKLFVKFQFTSLSPDAEHISLGIVSEDYRYGSFKRWSVTGIGEAPKEDTFHYSKSFYAEFTDFNIEKCDAWVKENVVSKLKWGANIYFYPTREDLMNNLCACGEINTVKLWLKDWLLQFSDYNIQFVCDCGTWDWYWMLQLLSEWDCVHVWNDSYNFNESIKCGLPKLPENISPVPQDLNDLIALKKGISIREAFEFNREEELLLTMIDVSDQVEFWGKSGKHNALWDAKVIKAIYEKLR